MTTLMFDKFSGIAPKIAPKRLAEPMAVIARNARFDSGAIAPWKGIAYASSATYPLGTKAFYPYEGAVLNSTTFTQYAESPNPNDTYNRIYATGVNYPTVRSHGATYRLGLPRPAAPDAAITAEGDMTNITDVRNQSYIAAIVDSFGTEGPSSLPTISFTVGKGGIVTVDITACHVTGNYNLGVAAKIRLYRTNTGTSGSAIFQFLADVPYSSNSYVDSIEPAYLQEELISSDWIAAPDDNSVLYPSGPLQSLVNYPGGILAGHTGKTVYFSVPQVPSAWPYSYTLKNTVVGLVVIQGGLFVCTTGQPVLLTGSDPSNMVEVPIESFDACSSQRSIVDMGDFALYASPQGLVAATGNTATLVTGDFYTKDQWAALQPTTMRGYRYQGKYICFYGPVADGTGFIFDPTDESSSFVEFTGYAVDSGYFDPASGELNLGVVGASNMTIGQFNTGSALALTWKSREVVLPDPTGYSAMRVQAAAYPVTVTVTADGVDRTAFVVPNSKPFRMAGGYKARVWQLQIQCSTAVDYVELATTMGEIT